MLAMAFCSPMQAQQPCVLPAYAHNDYENRRPLLDAIEAGYAGVEVDYFLVGGRLLVGHDRSQLSRDRTLQSLYLDPLRRLTGKPPYLCGPNRRFLLNIETKQSSQPAFDSLRALLDRYPDLFGPQGSVDAILVGWTPPLDSLGDSRIQFRVESGNHLDSVPPDPRVALISVRYRDLFRWNGRGITTNEFGWVLDSLVHLTRRKPGRRLRIYEVPYNADLYRALLDGGVDLLGIKDLERGRRLLVELGLPRKR